MGRIMALADACSAMLLDRPYRKGMDWAEVRAELRRGSGSQFDPALVGPFIEAIERSDYLRRLRLG
jgi:HD-GYP domain-containing protein (c-di-GMP phosphodiesterase class II)